MTDPLLKWKDLCHKALLDPKYQAEFLALDRKLRAEGLLPAKCVT